jgi:hypothetical protein
VISLLKTLLKPKADDTINDMADEIKEEKCK